tara:strand:+ start:5636 stop:6844 length:1209 start_codon:yes stop_codon:yes gene_type:complete
LVEEKMSLSERVNKIKPSPTMEITAKAKSMKENGIDIIGFGAGEPDFDTPDFVKDAAKKALDEGKTKYTDAPGLPKLRDALIDTYKRDEGLDYKRSECIISLGGKHALYNIFQAIVSSGDEVIIPTPYWVSYPDQVLLADGVPIFLETREEDNFLFTAKAIEALVTDRTKAIVVNSPSNPTGNVYDQATLESICQVAIKNDLWVISDEIYKDVYYGKNKLRSLPAICPEASSKTLVCSGLSKNFSMTGWRVGWTLGDESVIKAMIKIQGQSTSNPVTFAQYGAIAALEAGPAHVGEWLKAFRNRRDTLLKVLKQIDGISCLKPEGAFYLFPNISGLYGKEWSGGKIMNSYDVTRFLLEQARVAVVPGAPFGAPNNIRFSYALNIDDINKGIDRIKEAVALLK